MTSLVRYYSPINTVIRQVAPALFGSPSAVEGFKLDVTETPEAYVVRADVPGVAKDQINVDVEDRNLTIEVSFAEDSEGNGKSLWRERSFGKARRALRLPEAVDAQAAVAKHLDGVLELTLPKLAKANAKKITIN